MDGRIFHTDTDSTQSETSTPRINLATEVDSGSNDEISKVDYEIEGDIPDDDPETLDIDEQIEIYFHHNQYKVNTELAELVIEALEEMKVPGLRSLATGWSPYRF